MKINYNKLVRDNIPKIIRSSGKECKTYTLDDYMFLIELKEKLQEEIKELYTAVKQLNINDIVEEFADVYEVLDTMAELFGINKETIKVNQNEKAIRKGRFKNHIFLESVEDNT